MPAFQGSREISGAVTPTTNDDGWMLDATAAATVTLTNSGWTVGRSAIGFGVKGSGAVTFVDGASVTLRNVANDYVAGTQYTACWVRYTNTNEWTIYGSESPQQLTPAQMREVIGQWPGTVVHDTFSHHEHVYSSEIGRASCRERVSVTV